MLRLYNTAALPLRLLAGVWAAWRSRDPERRREWVERRVVSLPDCPPHGIWIHGASVGEARLVRLLASALRRREPARPLAVSAFTPTGREQLPAPPEVDAAFFPPLDFAGYPTRLLDALRPSLLTLVETELWPNLIEEAARGGVPVVMVNGRLSPERMGRYRRLRRLYSPVLGRVTTIGAQTDRDARRFEQLGVDPAALRVTGNIKYDLPRSEADPRRWRERLGLAQDRPVFVAGSTGIGEEPPVVDAFLEARRRFPRLFMVLAPRHPRRTEEVATLLQKRSLSHRRLSRVDDPVDGVGDALLVDSVGQLGQLYALATVAFVGGSLVPVGGHNLLEPLAAGAPVLFGPHTEHFAEPAAELEAAGAGRRVSDAAELASAVEEILGDDEQRRRMVARGAEVLEANRGALERSLELMLEALR